MEGLTEKATCEQKPEVKEAWQKAVSGREKSKCEGPEARACLGCLRKPLWLEEIEEEQSRSRRGQRRGWPGYVGLVGHLKDFVFNFEKHETLSECFEQKSDF